MNFKTFHIFLVFLQCSIIVASFEPEVRSYHSAVYIENKLYIIGGDNDPADNFLYLDLSIPFHKDRPPWFNLDFCKIPFNVYRAAASFGGIDNFTIFLIGGERSEKETNYVYSFNTKSFIWDNSLTNDENTPDWHLDVQSVTDPSGKIYIYGGWLSGVRSNELSIWDTINLSWKVGPSPNSKSGRYGHTTTLLSNGIIVIIGGYVDGGGGLHEVKINYVHGLVFFFFNSHQFFFSKILLYDINENNWSSMVDFKI